MTYQSTMINKGQVVIPKTIRDLLGFKPNKTITFVVDRNSQKVMIEPAEDILDLAGSIKPKKTVSALRARTLFEKHYGRF